MEHEKSDPPPAYSNPEEPRPESQGYDQPGDRHTIHGQPGAYIPPPGIQMQQPQYGYGGPQQFMVIQSGQVQTPMAYAAPPDHMCLAIFTLLCCFWPVGIFAVIKANESHNSVARGDMVSAHQQATSAKRYINISIGLGIASLIIIAVFLGIFYGTGYYLLHDLTDNF